MTDLIQWLVIMLIPFLFAAAIVAEVLWLTRKGWASSGYATGYGKTAWIYSFVSSIMIFFFFSFRRHSFSS